MITKKQKLWTGKSLWYAYPSPHIPTKKLTRDIACDVVVIGAGISGAMIAEELIDTGFNVIIVDRRCPIEGSTIASTALLQYEIDTPLIHLTKKIGTDKACRAWRRSKLGLESLAAKINSLKISCAANRHHSLYLAGDLLNAKELQAEQKIRNAIGLYTQFLDQKALNRTFHIKRDAALYSINNLSVNPRRLTAGLLTHALKKGGKIYAPITVTDVKPRQSGIDVLTESGPIIKAKFAIFATGYEFIKAIKTKKHQIYSTWAFATLPQPNNLWPEQSMIWEASNPYLYIRTTDDGRVICGGEDEEFSDAKTRDALTPKKIKTLQKKLARLFPKLNTTAAFQWSGSFGQSTTGLPSIGFVPGIANCIAVMAYGGNGITFSRIAAELVRSLLTGTEDMDADIFKFH